jgi:hypothetical protein
VGGGLEDLRLGQLVDGLDALMAAQGDDGRMLDAEIRIVELLDEQGVDLAVHLVAELHEGGPDDGRVLAVPGDPDQALDVRSFRLDQITSSR